jgi:hypothetical protein
MMTAVEDTRAAATTMAAGTVAPATMTATIEATVATAMTTAGVALTAMLRAMIATPRAVATTVAAGAATMSVLRPRLVVPVDTAEAAAAAAAMFLLLAPMRMVAEAGPTMTVVIMAVIRHSFFADPASARAVLRTLAPPRPLHHLWSPPLITLYFSIAADQSNAAFHSTR